MTKTFELAVIDPTSHSFPLHEQHEMVRQYVEADIRIWMTDQTVNWWPDGVLEGQEITKDWHHAFWDRYVQIGYFTALFPEARWAVSFDVVRRKPDIIAQTLLTLHEFTGGRTHFSLAAGETKQLAPYGYVETKPNARLEETIATLKKIWSGEKFDFDGKTLQFKNAQQTLRSSQETLPSLSTIGFSPRLRKLAAHECDYAMVMGTQDDVVQQMKLYKEEAERAGRDPEALKFWGTATRRKHPPTSWFSYEDDSDIEALRKSPMAKFQTVGGQLPVPNSPFGPDYHYARDMVPTEWPRERVMPILDKVSIDDFQYELYSEDDMADWVAASVEVGIDMVRMSDRTPEIIASRRKGHPAFWARILKKAKKKLGVAPAQAVPA